MKQSWLTLERYPILFIPKLLGLTLSVALFYLSLRLWNLLHVIELSEPTRDISLFLLVGVYLLTEASIIFYTAGLGYSMYHEVSEHHAPSLQKAMRFAHDNFFHIAGISLCLYLLLGIPALAIILIILAAVIQKLNTWISAFFVALLLSWMIFTSWRLLFTIPSFMNGKEHALSASMQFARVHIRHTLISWLIVLGIGTLVGLTGAIIDHITAVDIWLALAAAILVVGAEIIISVWEHLNLFAFYTKAEDRELQEQQEEVQATPVPKKASRKRSKKASRKSRRR